MSRTVKSCLVMLAGLVFCAGAAPAVPIGVLTPSAGFVTTGDAKAVTVHAAILDPLTRRPRDGGKLKRFGVQHLGEQQNLLATLKPATDAGWLAEFAAKRPGDYTFYSESAPLWEAGEDLFIVYLTKVCINALGLEEGWGDPVGLEMEIIPLSRPYGLWTGNLFSGQVLVRGEPGPYAEVVIWRRGETAEPLPATGLPAAYTVQNIRADSNGVFHYAMPRSGWWGFMALGEAEWSLNHDGDDKPVLLGAGFWVEARDLP